MITKLQFKENHKFKEFLKIDLSDEKVKLELQLKDKLKRYGITNYTINDDGNINVNGSVNLANKNLTEIPFKFNEVWGDFDISFNTNLTSLENAPKIVGGRFSCIMCNLISLENLPEEVYGIFNCSNNTKLIEIYGSKEDIINYIKANCKVGGEIYV